MITKKYRKIDLRRTFVTIAVLELNKILTTFISCPRASPKYSLKLSLPLTRGMMFGLYDLNKYLKSLSSLGE
ncbi:hypothetical protein BpHYR1_017632 [Brachionus plicatilis]|uniref:Uncharacterized protein n=1 Tax=Brachionus plicatilis TaxID=10195 RepID=A0A3M7SDS0_BRAPC|nr:hypothetical protein BpHYR1_017632 [Brachionus plicatilis]